MVALRLLVFSKPAKPLVHRGQTENDVARFLWSLAGHMGVGGQCHVTDDATGTVFRFVKVKLHDGRRVLRFELPQESWTEAVDTSLRAALTDAGHRPMTGAQSLRRHGVPLAVENLDHVSGAATFVLAREHLGIASEATYSTQLFGYPSLTEPRHYHVPFVPGAQ